MRLIPRAGSTPVLGICYKQSTVDRHITACRHLSGGKTDYGWVDDYRTAVSVQPIYFDSPITANSKPCQPQSQVF